MAIRFLASLKRINREPRRRDQAVGAGADGRRQTAQRDYLHNTVEVYDASGRRHLGDFDPWDARQVGPADPARHVEP
jgi:hypothetical protein